MKNAVLVSLSLLLCSSVFAQSGNPEIAIIPQPVKLVKNTGYFILPGNTSIEIPSGSEMQVISSTLRNRLTVPTGNTFSISASNPAASIRLILN